MIFISYSWQDFFLVQKILYFIKQGESKVWVDYERIDLSKSIKKQIEVGVYDCEQFIQFKSKNSIKSNWVKYEYDIAKTTKCIKSINIIEICEHPSKVEKFESSFYKK